MEWEALGRCDQHTRMYSDTKGTHKAWSYEPVRPMQGKKSNGRRQGTKAVWQSTVARVSEADAESPWVSKRENRSCRPDFQEADSEMMISVKETSWKVLLSIGPYGGRAGSREEQRATMQSPGLGPPVPYS